MPGEALWSLKCQNWSSEVAKKGYFSRFLDFSQKTNERICSNFTQMFVFPCPIHWRDRFGRTISTKVGPKRNAQCDRSISSIKLHSALHISLSKRLRDLRLLRNFRENCVQNLATDIRSIEKTSIPVRKRSRRRRGRGCCARWRCRPCRRSAARPPPWTRCSPCPPS